MCKLQNSWKHLRDYVGIQHPYKCMNYYSKEKATISNKKKKQHNSAKHSDLNWRLILHKLLYYFYHWYVPLHLKSLYHKVYWHYWHTSTILLMKEKDNCLFLCCFTDRIHIYLCSILGNCCIYLWSSIYKHCRQDRTRNLHPSQDCI